MKDRGLCTTFVYKWRLLHKEQNLSKKYLYDTFKNIVKILCLVKNMLHLCSFAIVIYIVMIVTCDPCNMSVLYFVIVILISLYFVIVCGEPVQKINSYLPSPSEFT